MQHEKITTRKSAANEWCSLKRCNMKRVQHKKKQHDVQKKCARIVQDRAQTDNGPSVDGPLYTSINNCPKGEATRLLDPLLG